jgi:hypothetical protein
MNFLDAAAASQLKPQTKNDAGKAIGDDRENLLSDFAVSVSRIARF